MIFSEQWLREWVNPSINTEQLIEQLTMAGLEVDDSNAVAGQFNSIVVAEVVSVEPHPDADKLNVCTVFDGTDNFQVVCGANNVRPGLKAPFAQIGAVFTAENGSKPFKIKKAKLRGVESNGMLCSTEELGLSDSADGLMELSANAPVGKDIREYLKLDDCSIELDLTPNRGDCLGMIGLAREVGVLNRDLVQMPDAVEVESTISDQIDINILAPEQCPRYLGRVIKNINLDAQCPDWMQERLRRCGLRCIDPIVDVTNYVLLELGQPLHAFDYDKIDGSIEIRMAEAGEKLTLLDGKEVVLTQDTTVIADSKKALAMAGIMGGLDSAVQENTTNIFLECAFFAPLAIAGKARGYGMHTDASHRYERGVDYNIQQQAIERASELLLEIVGGEAGPVIEQIGHLPEQVTVKLNFSSVKSLLGIEIETGEIENIFVRLGLKVVEKNDQAIVVEVPSFRFDISIEADLIEELARIYGYNNLPQTEGLFSISLKSKPEAKVGLPLVKHRLVSLGYQEVVTYSFVEPGLMNKLNSGIEPVVLQNPISSDMSVMRTSLWPGLLAALKHNENRQQNRIRLFESGLAFHKKGEETDQPALLAGLIYGNKLPEQWGARSEAVDFFDLKGDLESLLTFSRQQSSYSFSKASHPALHKGQCASILRSGEQVGLLGALDPRLQRELDISGRVFLFELELTKIEESVLPAITDLSKFPEVTRDLSIVVDSAITSADIAGIVRENAGAELTDLRLFDVYQGDAIEKNQKSIALGLTWQHPSRTLSEQDINSIIGSCVNALEDKFNAKLRN